VYGARPDPETGAVKPGAAHLMVINSPDRGLVFYTAMGSRSGEAIEAGLMDGPMFEVLPTESPPSRPMRGCA